MDGNGTQSGEELCCNIEVLYEFPSPCIYVATCRSSFLALFDFIRQCQWKTSSEVLLLEPVSQKILSPLVILSMEKIMVTMVISELKSISRLKNF